MNKRKRNRLIINSVILVVGLSVIVLLNIKIHTDFKQRLDLTTDGTRYCYGIDSVEKKEEMLKIKGWFLELKSIRGTALEVGADDSELMIALLPVEEVSYSEDAKKAVFMNVLTMHEERPDVNEYFSCKYDYSKCGFTASIECSVLDSPTNTYRLAVKPNAKMTAKTVLTNVYIKDGGIFYTNPMNSPALETAGTDLDGIVNAGVRLANIPEYDCYVYQLGEKLYWIADEDYQFNVDGKTIIQYQIDTTQIDKLPDDRIKNNWLWSNIGDCFENHEVTQEINCGKYRVSVRDIPRDYSVTEIVTGYYDNEWIWRSEFKPCYSMII